jgi:hypothetical protein
MYIPNAHSTFSLRSLKLDIRPKGAEGPLVSNSYLCMSLCCSGFLVLYASRGMDIKEKKMSP